MSGECGDDGWVEVMVKERGTTWYYGYGDMLEVQW